MVAALVLLFNRQFVIDQISVWQYHPNSQVAALVDRTTMNKDGKFYFYASHPALEETQNFNKKCDRKEESTAILGCYTGRFIYIYNVTDTKLDGIREVTAAHEMLHAVYDRLSADEQTRLNVLLDAEYAKLKIDKKLAERMAFYARTEPGERENELHSVIGTEIAAISPELESHYKRYFTDRAQVVALHTKYESVFNDLQSRGESLSNQLTKLGDDIEASTVNYNRAVNQLNDDIMTFNTRANNGGFSSESEFNSTRNSLVTRASQLETQRLAINDMVKQYETLRQELLSIASQSEALNRSIDSSLAPAPSL
jgi:hypothetical protein